MENVEVVVTLPLSVKEMLRREFKPQFVIFDESSFYRDPEIFHVLGQLRENARVLFVGDHKQLSPPVFTQAGRTVWSIPVFERLANKEYHWTLLNVSYRPHKMIYQPTFVAFYEGAVTTFRYGLCNSNHITKARPLVVRFGTKSWKLEGFSHFLHLKPSPNDVQKDASGSSFHVREAEFAIVLAKTLIDRGARNILIMSPDRAQVALVKRRWETRYQDVKPPPKVQTVDASQGSEATVVTVLVTHTLRSTTRPF